MVDLFFGGTEQRMWRTLLANEGVRHVSLSYIGLRRRIKDPSKWRIADNYPAEQKVFLDSGTFSLNKKGEISQTEADELAQQYMDFIDANIDSVEFVSEFDAEALGSDLINDYRAQFYQQLPPERWMPVWHGSTGASELRRLAEHNARVGVLQTDSKNGDVSTLIRKLGRSTRLHGLAMTHMESMQQLPWDSVGSTSWLSTTQFGDTFVWDGHEMHRYPKKYKEEGRNKHSAYLAKQGFDVDKILADDNDELLKLSIWSWTHFAESIETMPETEPTPSSELVPRREKKLLPVLGFTTETRTDADGTETETQLLTPSNQNLLQCDTCYIKDSCPMFTPHSECAYEIPVRIRTGSQLAALQDSLIEIQTRRVLFMQMVEQAEGGHVDANLSNEIDRLNKLVKDKHEASKESFSLKIEGSATPGSQGMISRIFGRDDAEAMGSLPEAIDASEVLDAQIVGE